MGRGHVAALDGVRGLAVLGVMSTHLMAGNLPQFAPALNHYLGFGVMGVDVFFVLSGFLITGILRDSLHDSAYFRKFYARRVLRIFPLYYGVVLILISLTPLLHVHWNGVNWSLLLYLQNTHVIWPSLVHFHNPFFSVDHLWSLAVEEQFYLVWPLVVASVPSKRKLFWVCIVGIAASFLLRVYCLYAGFGFDWTNRNTLCRSDELLAGAALALVMRSEYSSRVLVLAKQLLLAAIAFLALQQVLWRWVDHHSTGADWIPYLTSLNYTGAMLLAVGLILCCLRPGSRVRSVFQWKPLRWLGRYSYGLYVLHLILLPGLTLLLLQPLRSATGSRLLPRLLIGLLVFCVSCAAAYASFHLYEKQFLRLKRFFDYADVPSAGR